MMAASLRRMLRPRCPPAVGSAGGENHEGSAFCATSSSRLPCDHTTMTGQPVAGGAIRR